MSIQNEEQLQAELDRAQRAMDRAQWERQVEQEKQELFGDAHPGHTGEEGGGEFRLETTGVDDIHLDEHGRVIIGGEVQFDPAPYDPWSEENPHAGESPAARQIRLGEQDRSHNPGILVEQEEPLPQAQSEPCPGCGVCSDLRNPHTNITGYAVLGESLGLGWTCRCGTERFTDARVLPPDLAKRGDDEFEFLQEVASHCEKEPAW